LKPTAHRWKNLKPETCNTFAIYKLLANEEQLAAMTANYLGGNYGYSHQTSFVWIDNKNIQNRKGEIQLLHEQPSEVDALLKIGANKAATVANGC
jgi:tryptophanyl-tRNA synthetase